MAGLSLRCSNPHMRTMTEQSETRSNQILSFVVPGRDARGRVVRLDAVLDEILGAHDYPPAIAHLLAEALVLAALIGSLLKDDQGQMTMQAQTEEGAVRLLVVDYRHGELRGYADFDAAKLSALGANPSLFALFGRGYFAITFDLAGDGGRYQGVVPLEGESLAEACQSYFAQSEQVPTLIRVAVSRKSGRCVAGGLLAQHMPDGEEGRERLHVRFDDPVWEHVAVLAGSVRHDELLDQNLTLEEIVWRLFHEEEQVRIDVSGPLGKGCRCSVAHFESVIRRFPEADQAEMRDADGHIMVDCAFCSRVFQLGM